MILRSPASHCSLSPSSKTTKWTTTSSGIACKDLTWRAKSDQSTATRPNRANCLNMIINIPITKRRQSPPIWNSSKRSQARKASRADSWNYSTAIQHSMMIIISRSAKPMQSSRLSGRVEPERSNPREGWLKTRMRIAPRPDTKIGR